jgi:glycosyltransferase involved in cell wall biosynthesis
MRIGINLLYLIPNECGGTETYGVCLVNALAKLDPENEYVVFINLESKDIPIREARNLTKVICNVRAVHRPLRYFYEQLILPFLLYRYQIDLTHSLGYVAPLLVPCINVVTVPDMNYVDLKQNFTWLKRLMLGGFSIASIRLSRHVITISHFSKSAICQRLGVDPNKVTVTHLGPGWLGEPAPQLDWEPLRAHYNLPEKYIIAFGGGALHKNIQRLIQAYLGCPDIHGYTLAIMGRIPANVTLPVLSNGEGAPKIQSLGFVPNEHIQPLLSHSSLYVLPSLYEGFGMPILEAQFAGALIASSNAASLPEIGGDGAMYFEPTSVPAIAEAMKTGLNGDVSLAQRLREAAKTNLARFSWKATAQDSLNVYLALLNHTPVQRE